MPDKVGLERKNLEKSRVKKSNLGNILMLYT